MNAVWDLVARRAGKPLWRLLAEMSPEELVAATAFRYISDAITPDEALRMLRELAPTRAERIEQLRRGGYPCYTTSAGWLGYDDDKLRRLLKEAVDAGYRHVKLKVGLDIPDRRRSPSCSGSAGRHGARRHVAYGPRSPSRTCAPWLAART